MKARYKTQYIWFCITKVILWLESFCWIKLSIWYLAHLLFIKINIRQKNFINCSHNYSLPTFLHNSGKLVTVWNNHFLYSNKTTLYFTIKLWPNYFIPKNSNQIDYSIFNNDFNKIHYFQWNTNILQFHKTEI